MKRRVFKKRGRDDTAGEVLQEAKARASELTKRGNPDDRVFLQLSLEFTPEFIDEHRAVLLGGAIKKAKKKARMQTREDEREEEAALKPSKDRWAPRVSPAAEALDAQVAALAHWLIPTAHEAEARRHTVQRLREQLKPADASLTVVGSFAHGLYLPNSDVDVVVENHPNAFQAVSKSARKIGVQVKLIRNARVPIVKYVDSKTGVAVDVCFDQPQGAQLNSLLSGVLAHFGAGKLLIKVVKYYLNGFSQLCDPACGGLGSYSVFCLCVSFLQHRDPSASESVSELLMAFFRFWGREFNSEELGVALLDGGSFFSKSSRSEDFHGPLALEDPLDADNNVGRATRKWSEVRRLFCKAHEALASGKSLAQLVARTHMPRQK
jgi:non-canonical poly(A) RNA polymerase PAPD5/7